MNNQEIPLITNLLQQAEVAEKDNLVKARELYDQVFKRSLIENDEKLTATCGYKLASLTKNEGDEVAAISYINSCLQLNLVKDSSKLLIQFNELGADVYQYMGQYDRALEHLLVVAFNLSPLKEKTKLGLTFNQIGDTHKFLSEYSEAILQHEKALKIFEELDDREQLSITNFHIGNCYNWADELDVAYNYLDKSLKIAEKLRKPDLKIKPLGSLAILFTKQKEYDKSLDHFFEAIDNCNLASNIRVKCDLLKSLGNLYNQMGRYEESVKVLTEAKDICTQLHLKQPTHLIHQFLGDAYAAIGDFKKAYEHHVLFHNLNREIQNEEVNLKSRGLQLRYNIDEIKKEKLLAEQSLLLKDAFLANVSHEFRTPINGIIGMAGLLNDSKLTKEQLTYVQTIKNAAFQLVDSIDDILDYARINTGQVKPLEAEVNIIKSMNDVLQKLNDKTDSKKNFVVENDFEENPVIIIDNNLLQKIIYNTLFFGCAYSSGEKISLTYYHTANKLFFNIKFNISNKKNFPPPEEIFELNNPQLTQAGLHGYGLGLSLVNAKGFTSITGGKILLKAEGVKFSFVIELPYKTAKLDDKPPVLSKSTEIAVKPKILLVEDNKINQFLARTMLEKKGFKVVLAADGNEALNKLNAENFDLVITDVQMPGMDGYVLATYIRTQLKAPLNSIPIIALTAYESSIEKEKAKTAGMTDYLTKPYIPEQLFEIIEKNIPDSTLVGGSSESNINDKQVESVYRELYKLMGNNKDETSKLILMFKEQFPDYLADVSQAFASSNMPELYKATHKLKSTIKLFKVSEITSAIEKIEKLSKENKPGEELTSAFNEVIPKINEIVKALIQKIS